MTRYLLLLFLFAAQSSMSQIYVDLDATGSNNGTTWDNAFTSVNDAVEAAQDGDEIWIAAGTYLPVAPTENPDTALYVDVNISIFGGFAGGETSLDERDPLTNRTTISGDHNEDDSMGDILSNKEDNNRHIFFVRDGLDGVTIDGLIIRNGKSLGVEGSGNNRRAGGVLAYSPCTLRQVQFVSNYGYFGGGFYPRGSGATGSIVENCEFLQNEAQLGAGIYMNAETVTVSDCEFTSNTAEDSGGGIYDNSSIGSVIMNCEFVDNQTREFRGAGIYLSDTEGSVMSCTFESNISIVSSGAAIQLRTDDDEVDFKTSNIQNCTFELQNARFGGAIGVYDSLTIANISGCSFSDNRSDNVGGAISNAFGGTTNVDACFFEANESGSGGAIYLQNDEGVVNVSSSVFVANIARNTGGALTISGEGSTDSLVSLSKLTVINSEIIENTAAQQGGGINLNDVNCDIVNTLIADNSTDDGATIGGGISINSGDTTQVYISILNSTIANNFGSFFAGIAHFTGEVDGFSELTMQNTILANDEAGDNYTIEAGTPTLISNGGNLSSDDTAEDALVGLNDALGEDPDFVNGEYTLTDESPAVNTGVDAGAPDTDILGNPRVGTVDKGAFENQTVVSAENVAATMDLHVFPNPSVYETLFVSMGEAFKGNVHLSVSDVSGTIHRSQLHSKVDGRETVRISVKDLPAGYYVLRVEDGSGLGTRRFIRAQ